MNDYLRPGKMPGGVKLRHCIEDLQAVFQRMPITDRDLASSAFEGMTRIANDMAFFDHSAREPYVKDWYLGDAAKAAVKRALEQGNLRVWIRLLDETVELDHEEDFYLNRWKSVDTLNQGKYRTLNEIFDEQGSQRSKYEGGTLWVKKEDWPKAREMLIAERERWSGSELAQEWRTLLNVGPEPSEYPLQTSFDAEEPRFEWSMYEAVAWLATRDQILVDQQRANMANYVATPRLAGAAVWLRLDSSIKLRAGEGWSIPVEQSASSLSLERLRSACHRGSVAASGLPSRGGRRRDIPRADFDHVHLWPGYGGCLHQISAGETQPAAWYDLRFDAEAVRSLTEAVTGALASGACSDTELAPPPLPKRRGRPPRYDWTGAMAALNELDGRDDLFRRIIEGELSQAVAEQFVTSWFEQRGKEPSESTVRAWVADTLQSRRESNAAKAGK